MYDETTKSQLIALCRQPGASVSRLARECGVNANQVIRWLREQAHGGRVCKSMFRVAPAPAAFVAVALPPPPIETCDSDSGVTDAVVDLKAHLPNGVAIKLHGVGLRHVGAVIEALGRLLCSASTKA